MYHNFLIYSSVDGHLGCFHVLAIVNRGAVNNGIRVSLSILVSSGYMPRSGIAGSYGVFFSLVFKGISISSSTVAVSIYIPTSSAKAFRFLLTLSSIYYLWTFWWWPLWLVWSNKYLCSFDLHFSNNERCWASFHVFVSHLYVFFGEMSV